MHRTQTLDIRTVPGSMIDGDPTIRSPEFAAGTQGSAHALPEGARLRDCEIVGCIGEGGFGIVYLAWDPARGEHIAIKEYLPAVLASRASASPAVVVKSQRHLESFRSGLRSFVNEARTLAQFDHPALVAVHGFWEDNGTAYMAMPYYVGPTLAQALAQLGHAPDEAALRGWLYPLLDALDTLHAAHCYHRDIAPDNILLTQGGPVLLDFGAARHVLDRAGSAPTTVFKPGFTPIEQYGQVASMKQGAWTDLYALASVLYAAITGQPPVPSVERLMEDRLQPLASLARGRYGAGFLAAVDAALALHPSDRPQSVAAFRALLDAPLPTADAARLAADLSVPEAPAMRAAAAPMATRPAPFTPTPPPVAASLLATSSVSALPLPGRPAPAVHRLGRPSRARLLMAGAALVALLVALGLRGGDPVLSDPPPMARPGPAAAPDVPAPVPIPVARPPLAPAAAAAEPAPPSSPIVASPVPAPAASEAGTPFAPAATAATVSAAPEVPTQAMVPSAQTARLPAIRAPARREPRRMAAGVPLQPAVPARGEAAEREHSAPARCTEILQRASLAPPTAAEVAFLRKECER